MFEALLERIGGTIERAGIPYMVIGGQAVLLYGEPRLTQDIDITLAARSSHWPTTQESVRAGEERGHCR